MLSARSVNITLSIAKDVLQLKEKYFGFYTNEKVCAIYDCCLNIKKLNHCGKCKELPCDRYHGFDPTKTPEENENDLIKQLALLCLMD